MEEKNYAAFLDDFFYSEMGEGERQNKLLGIGDSKLLHEVMAGYNWNDGLGIPALALEKAECELATALLIFWQADGYSYLFGDYDAANGGEKKWANFMDKLYRKICDGKFSPGGVEYKPDLLKSQVYRIKKHAPDTPDIFFQGTAP
ncbi:MAG: DUF4274 domain-containing protein [Spirochaetes bacterium]|nr:DUF4274 domain-containing protein [Spirochaetota bacterium]